MNITRIPSTPADSAEALSELRTLHSRPPALPADADLTPVLPRTGGVPGTWITAGRAAVEKG